MKKNESYFDFEKFFVTLYAAHYPYSHEAKLFTKKRTAFKKVEEYAQEIAEIQLDLNKQEIFGIQFFVFLGDKLEYCDLHLFLMNDFLKSYGILNQLIGITDELLCFVEDIAA